MDEIFLYTVKNEVDQRGPSSIMYRAIFLKNKGSHGPHIIYEKSFAGRRSCFYSLKCLPTFLWLDHTEVDEKKLYNIILIKINIF